MYESKKVRYFHISKKVRYVIFPYIETFDTISNTVNINSILSYHTLAEKSPNDRVTSNPPG